jgi:hypothetical protein
MKANCRLISGASQHVGQRLRHDNLAMTIVKAYSRATCANVGDVVANVGNGTATTGAANGNRYLAGLRRRRGQGERPQS